MESLAIKQLVKNLVKAQLRGCVPVGISNRHLHISEADFAKLFPGKSLRVKKWLGQPGEFASEETVTIAGPKGEIRNVRIIGPLRKQTQIELAMTDARSIGVNAPIKLSGELDDAASVIVRSQTGEVKVKGAIAAKRHVHMTKGEASLMGLRQGDSVDVEVCGQDRRTVFGDVEVRVSDSYALELHLDTDEANAANVGLNAFGKIL